MMNLENYRSSTEYREILRILQKSTALQDNILWQSHVTGKTVVPAQYVEIDFIAREVLINFSSEHHRIEPDLPLFVRLGYRTSVFKITEFRQGPNFVYFSFPDIIKTQELRTYPRHTFKMHQDKFVMLRSKDGSSELKVRAIDISETGLGLIVSEANRTFLKNNRVLWLTGLQEKDLQRPVLAEVMYMNSEVDPKFQTKKQKSLKVGLKLSGDIDLEIYNSFIP